MKNNNENYRTIKDTSFEGERPLFHTGELSLDNVTFLTGESALKHCHDIVAANCNFYGRYPIWHNENVEVEKSVFHDDARAAMWYVRNLSLCDVRIDAPKTLREIDGVSLRNVIVTNGPETLWKCRNVDLHDVKADGAEYIFMNCSDIRIDNLVLHGKYSFQYARNIEINNSQLFTKDAFWHAENITVRNSLVSGEYLGWHSHNLRLINCHISGTQPLCYCHNLILENCTMDADADLAFEYSTVNATINGAVTSIKNPAGGYIKADTIEEIILDEYCLNPGKTEIVHNN